MTNIIRDFIVCFAGILYEALPFIVLGALISGFVEEFIPQRWVLKCIPRNRFLAIAMGGWLGLFFPMCECGIIMVMRRLLRKGVPLSCGVCYMLAGPIINVVVMLSTFVAFSGMDTTINSSGASAYQIGGLGMMGLRVTFGFLVAFGTGLIVEWQYRIHGDKLIHPSVKFHPEEAKDELTGTAPRKSWFQALAGVSETGLHDFVDVTVLLIIGALLAAGARILVPHGVVEEISRSYPVASIGLMMALAVLLCLCSEADAFVAASFLALRPASKLAFLLLGPMLDFKLYVMYMKVFRPRLMYTIIASVVVQVYLYSLLVHFVWESYAPQLEQMLGYGH